ncbi:non-ribosomal peptide synthetase [Paenibacillus sp. SYP-B4298]|uniref:non-ribosomal peptide synthetase n=1 Tax=Paenibacillus sp. SYP-B4298 TaxID=2996034 RepID=UPI0022DD177A|nr:amino acid adenylation domain-containing protein [Paenibacillus sp. SYP-B4298]
MSYTALHHGFEAQVEQRPDAIAITCGSSRMTYRELNEKANQLAFRLRSAGVKPDTVVGIMLERSLDMMVAVFGVLKSGGAYLPLSPQHPDSRVRYMLENSQARLLLTARRYADKLSYPSIMVDDPEVYRGDVHNPEHVNAPGDLVYVIYTSGSTGRPKGVMIEHHSLVNRILWMQKAYPIGQGDVLLQKTPFTFDVSVWELLWWSVAGASVHLLPPAMEKFPQAILEAVETNKVTMLHFVPSMLGAFLNYVDGAQEQYRLRSLTHVFASGEALLGGQVELFYRVLSEPWQPQLTNLYGPTEATIDVSYYDCSPVSPVSGIVPIGQAIDGIELMIIGDNGTGLAQGEIGELYIAGAGVARGYANQPELTEERFIPHPDQPGVRMYKTGDLASWGVSGNLDYHGRTDHQVKIRGLRIELGEVEAGILSYSGVEQCAVAVTEESEALVKLVAYIVVREGFDLRQLRSHCKGILPDYMLPGSYVVLPQLPVTENGKIDRKSLSVGQTVNG